MADKKKEKKEKEKKSWRIYEKNWNEKNWASGLSTEDSFKDSWEENQKEKKM